MQRDQNEPHELNPEPGAQQTDSPRHLFTCSQTIASLHQYVEAELDPFRSELVQRHLAECVNCLQEKERLEWEKIAFIESAMEAPTLSPRFAAKVMDSVRKEERGRRRLLRAMAACFIAAITLLGAGVMRWSEKFGEPDTLVRIPTDSPISLRPVAGPADQRDFGTAARQVVNRRPTVTPVNWQPIRELDNAWICPEPPPLRELACEEHGALSGHDGTTPIQSLQTRQHRQRRFFVEVVRIPGHRHTVNQNSQRVVWIRWNRKVNIRDTVKMATRLVRSGQLTTSEDEPCTVDHNADGQTKLDDIAYGVQVFYGAAPPETIDRDAAVVTEFECDRPCINA